MTSLPPLASLLAALAPPPPQPAAAGADFMDLLTTLSMPAEIATAPPAPDPAAIPATKAGSAPSPKARKTIEEEGATRPAPQEVPIPVVPIAACPVEWTLPAVTAADLPLRAPTARIDTVDRDPPAPPAPAALPAAVPALSIEPTVVSAPVPVAAAAPDEPPPRPGTVEPTEAISHAEPETNASRPPEPAIEERPLLAASAAETPRPASAGAPETLTQLPRSAIFQPQRTAETAEPLATIDRPPSPPREKPAPAPVAPPVARPRPDGPPPVIGEPPTVHDEVSVVATPVTRSAATEPSAPPPETAPAPARARKATVERPPAPRETPPLFEPPPRTETEEIQEPPIAATRQPDASAPTPPRERPQPAAPHTAPELRLTSETRPCPAPQEPRRPGAGREEIATLPKLAFAARLAPASRDTAAGVPPQGRPTAPDKSERPEPPAAAKTRFERDPAAPPAGTESAAADGMPQPGASPVVDTPAAPRPDAPDDSPLPHTEPVQRAAPRHDAAKAAAAPKEIKIELTGADRKVEVRLTERAGELRFAVRTPDQRLAESLRENLPALAGRLEQSGFRAEDWRAAAAGTGERRLEIQEVATPSPAGAREQGGGREQPQQDHPRHPRAPAEDARGKEQSRKGNEFEWLLSSLR